MTDPARPGTMLAGNTRRSMLAVLGLGCLAGGAWLALRDEGDQAASAAALETFMQTRWLDAEGRSFDSAGLRGRPLILNFWATWCAPCVEEMPELDQLHRELGPIGLQIVGIGIDSGPKIEQFSRKSGISYPLLQAGNGGVELSRGFGNQSAALPYTVVIGRDGRVRERILGRFRIEALRRAGRAAAT